MNRDIWTKTKVMVVGLVILMVPLGVTASHRFTDVDNSNIFHDDISWLADVGVTRGCNPPSNTEFCPEDAVSRQQMAAFMRRLAEGGIVQAGQADRASFADDALELDGEPRETLLSKGFGRGDTFFAPLANASAPTYFRGTTGSEPEQARFVTANLGVTFTMDFDGPTATDHWLVCWISPVEVDTWDPAVLDPANASQRWETYPAGSVDVGGFHDVSLDVSYAAFLEAGESTTLYFQCADRLAGSAPAAQRFAPSANAHMTAVPTSNAAFFIDELDVNSDEIDEAGPQRPTP